MTYVLVLLTLILFLVFEIVLRCAKPRRAREPTTAARTALPLRPVSAPGGFFVDRGHTWLRIEPSGLVRVGADDFIRMAFGGIDRIELPRTGDEVQRGNELFSIRQGKRAAPVAAPVDGVVASVNQPLAQRADALQSAPYDKGWICTLRPAHLARDLRHLLIDDESRRWLQGEVERLREFFAARPAKSLELGDLSPDGGQLTTGLLDKVDEETWDLFVDHFLLGRGR